MKWFRFISFIAIFCLVFAVLNSLQPDQASERWDKFYTLPANTVDIVFMGNSHSFVAFNPEIIDGILNTNSYVVGFDAENIIASYYELKDVLKFQQPRAVVLETLVLGTDEKLMVERGHVYKFLDSGPLTGNKIHLIADLLFPDNLVGLFPLTRQRFDWEKPYYYLNNLKMLVNGDDEQIEPETKRGMLTLPNVLTTPKYEKYLSKAKPITREIYPENIGYMQKFLSACYQNDVIPLFVTTPTLETYPQNYDAYADILSKKYNMKILDFNQQEFQQLHFYDIAHVNDFGSVIVSTEMALKLSKELEIPVDQVALDYYRTYYYDQFSISQLDQKTTLTLFPMDEDAPMKYSWEIIHDDKLLKSTDYHSKNDISFSTALPGDYLIRVKIWNPEGDFVLEGEFTHNVVEYINPIAARKPAFEVPKDKTAIAIIHE